MTLSIRPLAASDGDALGATLAPAFAAGDSYAVETDLSPAQAADWWTVPGKTVFVAEQAGQILGTYYIRANAEGPGDHVCNCGYVTAEAARGRGIASAMLAHSLDEARRLGYRAMQFNAVVATNEAAIRLWERAGFDTVGRVPGAFRHPVHGDVDTLIMFKSLTEDPDAR